MYHRINTLVFVFILFLFWDHSLIASDDMVTKSEGKETVLDPNFIYSGVVVRVNDDAVTSAEVLKLLRKQLSEIAGDIKRDKEGHLNLEDFVPKALGLVQNETMAHIYNLLIYQFARKDLDKVEGIDKAIEKMREEKRKEIILQYGGSETKARKELALRGSTIEKELESTEKEMVISGYRDKHFTPTLKVTRSQLLQYYRLHLKDKFTQEATIEFELIDIWKSKNKEATKVAERAMAELEEGTEFAEVAKKYSNGYYRDNGGRWRPMHPDSVRDIYKPVVEALKQTEQGALTGIIETDTSVFIGRLIAYTPASVAPFSEVQNDIFLAIRDQRWDTYSENLGNRLLAEAVLGDIDGFIKATVLLAFDEYDRHLLAAKEN